MEFDKNETTVLYDGDCGFCKYWVIKWKRITKNDIQYYPFQRIIQHYPNLLEEELKKAVHLVDQNGKVYVGAAVPMRTLNQHKVWKHFSSAYFKFKPFKWLMDTVYKIIARNRNFSFKVSKFLFGKKP